MRRLDVDVKVTVDLVRFPNLSLLSNLRANLRTKGFEMPKMTLRDAADLLGLSVNGARSRAKAEPSKYGLTRDNSGRLWLDFDPSKLSAPKPSKPSRSVRPGDGSNSSTETRLAVLEAQLNEVRQDRDHWRAIAETLVARRRRFWPWLS